MKEKGQPRALDLFCGGGGASVGLARAGFDVVGVDKNPQPEYPFRFIQGDALDLGGMAVGFDLIWASPPCQRYSTMTRDPESHEDLVYETRAMLRAGRTPYVIENVPGAPLENPITLCGAMFGLGVIRHRKFECSFPIQAPEHVKHEGSIVTGEYVTVTGNGGVPAWTLKEREKRGLPRHIPGEMTLERWQEAMGIDWLSRKPLVQAIPPAYAEYIGGEFLRCNLREAWRKAREASRDPHYIRILKEAGWRCPRRHEILERCPRCGETHRGTKR